MKSKIFSKKLLVTLSIVLIAVMALIIAGCTNNNNQDEPTTTEPVQTTAGQSSVIDKGEGKNAFTFYVTDLDGNNTYFMIKTDKETVGEALVELELISGDESEYGLYVKTVNGITLDYDKDGKYWAFYENDAYASVGVDSTKITEGAVYSFKAE